MASAFLPRTWDRHECRRNANDRNGSRAGVRRRLRLPSRDDACAGTGGLGGRHWGLSKRGDCGDHRGRLPVHHRLPLRPIRTALMALEILPDARALRSSRRERALAQMEANDIDILVLGRQANVRYVTGAPQLWVAGTRPFAPICVVVRATGEIHLNSSWDEGMPEEIDHDHLYGLAWNPMTLIDVLKNIEGAATARRVGTDALSPTFGQLLPIAFPNADLVDGELAMRTARRIKTAEEVVALRGAIRVAEAGLAAGLSELAPGITEQSLTGAMLEAMAAGGVSTSATQDGAWVTSREHRWRQGPRDRLVADGDLVAFASGALADGYVGEVGRTVPVGDVSGADELFD